MLLPLSAHFARAVCNDPEVYAKPDEFLDLHLMNYRENQRAICQRQRQHNFVEQENGAF
jgi:hypothetical protein